MKRASHASIPLLRTLLPWHAAIAHLMAWLMKDSPHAAHDSCTLSFVLYHSIECILCSLAGPARCHCTWWHGS
eukprot:1161556-Pelagomonas_calceolata.AAC.13